MRALKYDTERHGTHLGGRGGGGGSGGGDDASAAFACRSSLLAPVMCARAAPSHVSPGALDLANRVLVVTADTYDQPRSEVNISGSVVDDAAAGSSGTGPANAHQ